MTSNNFHFLKLVLRSMPPTTVDSLVKFRLSIQTLNISVFITCCKSYYNPVLSQIYYNLFAISVNRNSNQKLNLITERKWLSFLTCKRAWTIHILYCASRMMHDTRRVQMIRVNLVHYMERKKYEEEMITHSISALPWKRDSCSRLNV